MATEIFYSKAYIEAGTDFDTTRKSGWINDSLIADPIEGIQVVAPTPLTVKQLCEVHSPVYVNALRTGFPRELASSAGFGWDEGFFRAICASNGGVVAAALSALKSGGFAGSLSSGLHHASYNSGNGFCALNGLAIAARAAYKAGARKILVLDLDAHCGGGTHDLLVGKEWVDSVDISVCQMDSYAADNQHFTLDIIHNPASYLARIALRLKELDDLDKSYDLVLYNSGMDAMEDCMIGGLKGLDFKTIAAREEMVFSWARENKYPLAFVLAGGYTGARLDEATLVALHRLTIAESARR
jgi:acetoin utilization deacetylase AcuC-like enzyme